MDREAATGWKRFKVNKRGRPGVKVTKSPWMMGRLENTISLRKFYGPDV